MSNLNYTAMDIDDALPRLAEAVMNSAEFDSRNGPTRDLTHVAVTLMRPERREITLPDRKHNLAAQIAETMWVLSGRDDIEWLGHYLPRAADFSDDGKVWRGAYGRRIRRWPRRDGSGDVIDQLAHVVSLLREDPNTRRAVIAVYDPQVDSAAGKDIPCNDFLVFTIRNRKLDLNVTIRSNDLMWGWSGINAFEWSALLEIVAFLVEVDIGELHFNIASLHLYEQHWERAQRLAGGYSNDPGWSVPFHPPVGHCELNTISVDELDALFIRWFAIEEAIREGQLADDQIAMFPEPMLRSWLQVLRWWWTGSDLYLERNLGGSRLAASAQVGVQPKHPNLVDAEIELRRQARTADFVDFVTKLHIGKHNAYGDSWKRRGEMLGIMANIARKIDRLGSNNSTADESAADTAIDLLVYLAKYRWWLVEHAGAPEPVNLGPSVAGDPGSTNALIRRMGKEGYADVGEDQARAVEELLTSQFDELEQAVDCKTGSRFMMVDSMLVNAYLVAFTRWTAAAK